MLIITLITGALVGIFDQIMGEDETVRDKAIEYVSVSLMDMRHKLFIQCEENEKFLVDLVKKVSNIVLLINETKGLVRFLSGSNPASIQHQRVNQI